MQYALAGARQHEGDITNIEFENDIFSDGALFESGLAYADSDALYLSRPGSMTTFRDDRLFQSGRGVLPDQCSGL